jgi:hypothetical protein
MAHGGGLLVRLPSQLIMSRMPHCNKRYDKTWGMAIAFA